MQLRQYQEGLINWFYTKNNSLTIIGGHLGFWQLWWYINFFLEYLILFVILKNICIEVSFVYLWWLKVGIRKFIHFFYWGGCSLDFHEGQLFVIYLFKSQKAFHMSTLFECRYLEDNFLVQSGDFCIHEYKIRFCKKFSFPPTPKSLFSKIMCNRRSSCAA